MLEIGFVVTPDTSNYKPFRNQPLTQLYLLTILDEKFKGELGLSLIDLRGVSRENVRFYIPEKDVYLYSAMTPEFLDICEVKDLIRTIYPKALHIVGGAHINLFPDTKGFDSVVIGEGDDVIIDIVHDMQNNELKPKYSVGKPVDLNNYPYPQRSYLPRGAVVDTGILVGAHSHLLGTNVLFSRGCPFECSFCANVNMGPTRFRSAELIVDEIEYLKKEYGVQALALKDDNGIPPNRKVAKWFLEAIGRTGVQWRGQSRANGINEEMVELAAQSGCTDIGIGIESVIPETLKAINKQIDINKAREYIQILKKHGIGVRIHIILGLPAEPDDIVSRTLAFIDEANPTTVLVSLFTPIPGSKMAMNPGDYGMRVTNQNFENFRNVFGTFDENEKPIASFEYNEVTPWGRGMKKETILENYSKLQAIVRERKLNF